MTLLAGVGVCVANADGAVMIRVPVGSDTFVKRHAIDTVRVDKAKLLARLLTHIPGNQRTVLIGTRSATYATVYLEGGIQRNCRK